MVKTQSNHNLAPGKHLLMGNVAVAEGALAAGLNFFAGYPITPSTEIPEHLAVRLPQFGGSFIQMEDELASINAVMGASIAGAKAMTATSGPGISLMAETISFGASMEIPFVLVDVQRNGPGTGFVTAPHHSDVGFAKYAGNGEFEVIAIAPMSCQECFDLTFHAFNLAETYRCPTYVLSDAYLGHIHEPVIIPAPEELAAKAIRREVPTPIPYASFSQLKDERVTIAPTPILGTPHFPKLFFSQPHGPTGMPFDSEEEGGLRFNQMLSKKILENVDKIAMVDSYLAEDAEILVIAYGLPVRSSYRAVNAARKEGIKAGVFRLTTIWPFPFNAVKQVVAGKKAVIMPEMNLGIMAEQVERVTGQDIPVIRVPRIASLHHPDEILSAIKEAAKK
jgi:2-oxoglutarate ferredoxin oxidoreductase subunit alpha